VSTRRRETVAYDRAVPYDERRRRGSGLSAVVPLLVLLCLLLAACGGSEAASPEPKPEPPVATNPVPRPLPEQPANPDLLAFDSGYDVDEPSSVLTVRPDGRALRAVWRRGDVNWNPIWSPDGAWIALNLTDYSSTIGVGVVAADATKPRRLVPEADGYSRALGWSPDAKQVLYVLSDPDMAVNSLWTVRIDGTGKRQLVPDVETSEATWSPDGHWIAFADDHNGDIHLYDVAAGRTRLLARDGSSPRWTPDAARLVFSRTLAGERSGIYVVGVEGGPPRLLHALADDESLSLGDVSPDGTWILGADGRSIYRISLDGDEPQELIRGDGLGFPDLSPDGRRIAFERRADIWVMDANGAHARVVARSPRMSVYMAPVWRP